MGSLVIPVTGAVQPVVVGGSGPHTERFIDPVSGASLWDFSDSAGVTNPYGVRSRIRSFDLGTVEPTQEFHEPGGLDLDELVYQRAGRTRSQFILRLSATSLDNLRQGVNELHRILSRPRVFLHQPATQAGPLYLDTLPAPVITPLVRGQGIELESKVLREFEDIDYLVAFWRQAYVREAELAAYVNDLANATLMADSALDGIPDSWTAHGGVTGWALIAADDAVEFPSDPSDEPWLYQDVAAIPGEIRICSAYSRRLVGTGGVRIYVEALNGSGGFLQNFGQTFVQPTGAFARYSTITGPLPTNTATLRMFMQCQAATATRWQRAQAELHHVARDRFTRPNSTVSPGRAESGHLWEVPVGVVGISGNQCYMVGGAENVAVVDTGLADGTLVATFVSTPTGDIDGGFTLRYADLNNRLFVQIRRTGGISTLDLSKYENGNYFLLQRDSTVGWLNNVTYHFRVELTGTQVKIYINEVLYITHNLSAADIARFGAATKHGIRGHRGGEDGGSRWDTFSFAPLAVPTGPSPFRAGKQTLTLDPSVV